MERENYKYKISLNEEEKFEGLDKFYDLVALKLKETYEKFKEIDLEKCTYDCREIIVSNNIQEDFFKFYREIGKLENYEIAMILLNYGPKMDESLQDYEILVTDKFLKEEENN